MGTRKSSRRKGAYKDMSTQSLLEVLSEFEKGTEFEVEKAQRKVEGFAWEVAESCTSII